MAFGDIWNSKMVRELLVVVIAALAVIGLAEGAVAYFDVSESWGDAVRHSALVSVAVAAAWWPVLGAVELATVLGWLVSMRGDRWLREEADAHPGSWRSFLLGKLRLWVVHSNRIVEGSWALLTLLVWILLKSETFAAMILFSGLCIFTGPHLARAVGFWIANRLPANRGQLSDDDLYWAGTPVLAVVTIASLILLFQVGDVANFGPAWWLGGAVVIFTLARLGLWWWWYYRASSSASVQQHRREAKEESKAYEILVLVAAVAATLLVPLSPAFSEASAQDTGRSARVRHLAGDRAMSGANPASLSLPSDGPWDVAVFLVADNQFRALNGKLSLGHSSAIDRIVPVAVRPVELDLLSGATLAHFAKVFHEAKFSYPGLKWAHLGDFADLACRSEIDRLAGVVSMFGQKELAGIAPGNHDSFFTGNFAWHPDWSDERSCPAGACPNGACTKHACVGAECDKGSCRDGECPTGGPQRRLGKEGVIARMGAQEPDLDTQRDRHEAQSDPQSMGFLTRLVRLNPASGADPAGKPIYGLFLDTADYDSWFWLGAAGVIGTISHKQQRWALDRLAALPQDAQVVVFQHHPFESLSGRGASHIREMSDLLGERLLAIVSAHTHNSGLRRTNIAKTGARERVVLQIVVGSTTDPPQEAGLLLVKRGTHEVAFTTIPAVARPQDEAMVTAANLSAVRQATCTAALTDLGKRDRCQNVLGVSDAQEKPAESLAEQRERHRRQAHGLVSCVRDMDVPESILDESNPYRWLGQNCDSGDSDCLTLSRDVTFQDGLVCLAWAASILQGHKQEGWSLGIASKLAGERLATYLAWRYPEPSLAQATSP